MVAKPVDVDPSPFDALLLVSFGGPEAPEEVLPFLENVTAGKDIPRERLVEVGEHYYARGGRSPINDANRALAAGIQADLVAHDIDIPVYWGNRNWRPYLPDVVEQMAAAGVRDVACFVTSGYSSYSGCRQYREDLYAAAHGSTVRLHRLRHYFNHPGFLEPVIAATRRALARTADPTRLVFVTHSIPLSMNAASGGPGAAAYECQHHEVARLVAAAVGHDEHDLVYCSRSGPPQVPWLEPDINDHLQSLAEAGVRSVAVVPIGFVSDHMEVVHDLDTEAAATAQKFEVDFVRVDTPDTSPEFVAMVRQLMLERAASLRGQIPERPAWGDLGPWAEVCPVDCCLNPQSTRTALA